jgi:hypothetical protein
MINNDLHPYQQFALELLATRRATIVCPNCGYDGTTSLPRADFPFHFVCDVPSYSRVVGLDYDGEPCIDTESEQDWDGSSNDHFECGKCHSPFSIPRDCRLSWV